jgi:outer membrane protein OmpA-like peptidoglycan-associated protein
MAFAASKPTSFHLSREERTIYADFGQASLTAESKQRLDALAELLASEKNITGIRIVGYADRVGNAYYNQHLAQQRVENVQRYLVTKGLVKARTADTRWLGAQVPATECADNLDHGSLIDCLRQDRRVEIEIDYRPSFEASSP